MTDFNLVRWHLHTTHSWLDGKKEKGYAGDDARALCLYSSQGWEEKKWRLD